jgi:hypothetical protein
VFMPLYVDCPQEKNAARFSTECMPLSVGWGLWDRMADQAFILYLVQKVHRILRSLEGGQQCFFYWVDMGVVPKAYSWSVLREETE